ncbi:MAG: c-type cytochrome, partial [Bryobacteraceae bacterium]
MSHRRYFGIRGVLLAGALVGIALAQESSAPRSARGPREGARGERTREFLGLGPTPDPAAAARGEKLYASSCAFCHGAKATGAEGPDLVRSAVVLHDDHGETIGPVVLKGRQDRGMPSFPNFTEAQISDIAAFLHMRVEMAANRGLYKVLNVVTGDAAAGKAYFNGAGRCSTCHSPTGDLAHVASKYSPADLQAQFLYPGAASRYAPGGPRPSAANRVTVTLSSGESISGTLKALDDFNVSVYDSSGDYHSWPRDGVKVKVRDPLAAHRELLGEY